MNIDQEVALLERTSTNDLKQRFAELCGYLTRNRNRTWLIRRIAWRLQANAQGGLSERARARAAELASGAQLRTTAPRARRTATIPPAPREVPQESLAVAPIANVPDRRLPLPGGMITRNYKGRTLHVTVLDNGLEFDGQVFKSLSAVAKQITGAHCNGFHFFRLSGGSP